MNKVTINVVAQQADVSKKTVSRVFNNEPNVSHKTRQKVLNIASALGYKPNPLARGLASNQSFILALLYDNPNTNYINNIQTGALEVCQDQDYHLLIHPCKADSKDLLKNVKELIGHSRLDGLVLTPPLSDLSQLIDFLVDSKMPFVRIGATDYLSCSAAVVSNDEQTSFEMTQYLISLGHSAIGFVKGHPQHNSSSQRFRGFQRALDTAHISLHQQWIQQGDYTFDSGESCARQILTMAEKPSAIFCSNDYMAAGVLKVANQLDLSVPHQLSVTGFDDAPISRYIWPSITTIQQPVEDMARRAAALLIERLKRPETDDIICSLESQLIKRESTAPFFKGKTT